MTPLVRLLLAQTVSTAVDALVLAGLLDLDPERPLAWRLLSLAAGLLAGLMVGERRWAGAGKTSMARTGGRLWPLVLIAGLVNLAVYAALLANTPILHPLAAFVLSSLAAILFCLIGWRRLRRRW